MNGIAAPHRSRNAVAVATAACLVLACEGDYPIAPTICDDWCQASDNVSCGDYLRDPAECVAECESSQKPSTPECTTKFRNVIDCLNRMPPSHDYCGQQGPVCVVEYAAMDGCNSLSNVPSE